MAASPHGLNLTAAPLETRILIARVAALKGLPKAVVLSGVYSAFSHTRRYRTEMMARTVAPGETESVL